MAVFAILAPPDNRTLGTTIEAEFPNDFYQITEGQWLIAASGLTAQQVSEKIGLPGGKNGRGIVVSVTNYSGWHANEIWEWLKPRWSVAG